MNLNDSKAPDAQITRLLNLMVAGDTLAQERAWTLVYPELCAIAERADWRTSRPGHTQAMDLLSEGTAKILRVKKEWANRTHFYATFATIVGHVLIDRARESERRPSKSDLVDDELCCEAGVSYRILDLHEALQRLEKENFGASLVVRMRFFLGLTIEEIADDLKLPRNRVKKLWTISKNRLSVLLGGPDDDR